MPRPALFEDWFRNIGLLLLRLGSGLYMAIGHGWPKIAGPVGEQSWLASASSTLGPGLPALLFSLISIGLELFGGTLTALGCFTRTVSASLTLYVVGAYLIGLGLSGELVLLYGAMFTTLALTGPGTYSIDKHLTPVPYPAYVVVSSTTFPADDA